MMKATQIVPRKRALEGASSSPETTRVKRRDGRSARGFDSVPTDRLTSLPQELFFDILQRVEPTPLSNVRMQGINSRFCETLRDNVFWRQFSPDVPPPAAALTRLQRHIKDADQRFRQTEAAPQQLLYWQFQARTSVGSSRLTQIQQSVLRHLWQHETTNPLLPCPNSPYDLARAAVLHAPAEYLFSRYNNDASFMYARALRGVEFVRNLGDNLRSDVGFVKRIIDIDLRNYAFVSSEMRNDETFSRHLVHKHGHALTLMSESMRSNKAVVLTALKHWDLTVQITSPLVLPYQVVAASLRQDPDVIYALTKLCAHSFVCVVNEFPHSQWASDRQLVTLALSRQHFTARRMKPNPFNVFSHVHSELRDDEEISLLAIRATQSNYALVSPRLRSQWEWCAKALAANPEVAHVLEPNLRNNPKFIAATMRPADQYARLGALHASLGSDRVKLVELLTHPEVKKMRRFDRSLLQSESVYRRISPNLQHSLPVLRDILDFDAREIGFFAPVDREKSGLYDYARRAFLVQTLAEHRLQSMRQNDSFSAKRSRAKGHPALGVFARDKTWAQQFLLRLPGLDYLFTADVRAQPDVIRLSRLGSLLQAEAGADPTWHLATSAAKKLVAELRDEPNSYTLHLALGALHLIRGDWSRAQPALTRSLSLAQNNGASRRATVCRALAQTFPESCPVRGDFWYRGVMALARQAYTKVLDQAGLVDEAGALER